MLMTDLRDVNVMERFESSKAAAQTGDATQWAEHLFLAEGVETIKFAATGDYIVVRLGCVLAGVHVRQFPFIPARRMTPENSLVYNWKSHTLTRWSVLHLKRRLAKGVTFAT